MNKDRISGATKQVVGATKEAAGKILGDTKLKVEGKTEILAGKAQSAVGVAADKIKAAVEK